MLRYSIIPVALVLLCGTLSIWSSMSSQESLADAFADSFAPVGAGNAGTFPAPLGEKPGLSAPAAAPVDLGKFTGLRADARAILAPPKLLNRIDTGQEPMPFSGAPHQSGAPTNDDTRSR
ncbi:MAG: hypothetical protein AB1508_12525 [Pseudomonadota bacterium]